MTGKEGTSPEDKKVVLVVDDDDNLRRSVEISLKKEGYRTLLASNGDEAIEILRDKEVHLLLTDLKMPKTDGLELLKAAKVIRPEAEVIVMTAYGTIESAVEAMKYNAYDFIEKPFNRQTLLALVKKAFEKQSLIIENRLLREKLMGITERPLFIGNSEAAQRVIELVEQIASSKATVLIQGKSGTGKGLVAKLIHQLSGREAEPFVHVSCAAIPETLLEAELFGYEKGAFTGAISRKEGRFEVAGGGSLFLDEIGEVPPSTQVKLLRVLQEGEFERVGGEETIRVDVRIIAATNQNLSQAIKEKRFREDLFYR
ncbi:MAG: sigma-54-dependent transcriptional regulator, partial [Candidatus Glassbacteria bacterium]